MYSFLLIGQSNMSGRGRIAEAHKIDTTHIYTLRNGRWQKMFRPICSDRSFAGVSLGESFAEAVANAYGEDVGLICCSDGGTTLDQWKPGDVLFDNAVNCAKLAMRTSTLVGILWHQGEGDCAPHLAATYRERFSVMVDELRRQLGAENVPLIVGGLGDFLKDRAVSPQLANYPIVNKALIDYAESDDRVAFVGAEGLGDNGDKLHFNSDALYEFGLRYFDAFRDKFAKADSDTPDAKLERTAMELL
jgi:hypothetical protein